MHRWIAFVALLAARSSIAAADDGLRCGNDLVNLGMREDEVVARCGPPTQADRKQVRARRRRIWGIVTIDTWVYDRGPMEFVRTLTFTDGSLTDVVTGDYGH